MEHNIKVTRDLVYTAMQKLDDKGYKNTPIEVNLSKKRPEKGNFTSKGIS